MRGFKEEREVLILGAGQVGSMWLYLGGASLTSFSYDTSPVLS